VSRRKRLLIIYYNIVDAVFIGRLGPTALAAMAVTFPLVLSLVAIASGTAAGVTSIIARSFGAGDHTTADRTAGAAITLCFLLSGMIAAVCLPFLDSILGTLGAPTELFCRWPAAICQF
jgi:Na+-driven multidrug efflux pump